MKFIREVSIFKIFEILTALCILLFPLRSYSQAYRYPFGEDTRDPFCSLISKSGQILISQDTKSEHFLLKGIIYSPEGSVAIINDEVFKEKDEIGTYIVFKIEAKSVILKKDSEEIILKLEEE